MIYPDDAFSWLLRSVNASNSNQLYVTFMSKKPGDAKEVFVGSLNVNYEAPTAKHWERYERILGRSLPEPLREEIFLATKHFGEGGWASKRTLTNTELLKKLDLWRLRTKVLRREISDAEPIKLPEAATRADVVNGFFKWSESAAEQPFGGDQLHVTSQLAFALDAALVACDVIVREISDPRFRNDRGPALWTVWVAIIIQCMAKYEILVEKDRGSKRVVDPPFVEFIEALQKTLPPEEQRRRKFDSLKRGVQHAVVSSGRTSLEVLRSLMNKWGTLGADRLDSHQILPEFDLYRFQITLNGRRHRRHYPNTVRQGRIRFKPIWDRY